MRLGTFNKYKHSTYPEKKTNKIRAQGVCTKTTEKAPEKSAFSVVLI